MATAEITKQITPEELLALPDGKQFELVGGELVERNMGMISSRIGGRILKVLGNFADQTSSGQVFGADAGYQCYPDDPLKLRKPDVSFLRNDRLPPDEELEGWCRVAPNLAVEVVSPNDLDLEVEAKVEEYLAAGVELVWVVRPPRRSIRVHRADGSIATLHLGDSLDGENVLSGFHCPVADIFK